MQTTLAANVNDKRTAARATEQSILASRLFDDRSDPMVARHACKGSIGKRERVTSGYVLRLVRLAFLSPEILAAVVDSRACAHLGIASLTTADGINPRWDDRYARSALSPGPDSIKSRTAELPSGEKVGFAAI